MTAMPIREMEDSRSRVARAAGVASLALIAILPLAMTVANRSAPAILTSAALLALLSAAQERGLRSLLDDIVSAFSGPVGLAGLALTALAAASIAWSGEPGLTLFALGEALLPAGAALALILALPRERPAWIGRLFAICAVVAAIDIIVELSTDQAARRVLGLRPDGFVFNRSAITLVVLAWPLSALLVARGRLWSAAVVAAIIATAVLYSHSGAAALGLVIGFIGWGLATVLPRVAMASALAGLVAALALAPVMGDLAARIVPQRLYAALASTQPRDRVAVWQSFGAVVAARPLAGTGFGTTRDLSDDPVAREVPPEHRQLLSVGHPHSAFLQLWAELGLAGALAGATLVFASWRALERLSGVRFATTYAFGVSALSIALVGHGAWQGWWIATLGAGLVWLKLAAEDRCGRASADERL